MKLKLPKSTGLLSIVAALALILVIYTLLGTVNIVVVDAEGKEISTQEDVGVFSEIHVPSGELSCTVNGEEKPIEDINTLKVEIGKTVLMNLVTFKWQAEDNVITVTQK